MTHCIHKISWQHLFKFFSCTHECTHAHTQPFYGSLDFVWDYPGEPVPKQTVTHSHLSWLSIILYLLPPSTAIHGILPLQFTCLTSLFAQPLSEKFSLVYHLVSHPPLYTPHKITQLLSFFFAHANTIATCFAVVLRSYNLILVSLNSLLELFTWNSIF